MHKMENVIARSQPDHKRSEDRLKFNHEERKPMVIVELIQKKFFDLRKGKSFSILDISPSGACLMHVMNGSPKISVNDQLRIKFSNGLEILSEVKWIINNFESPYSEEKNLAVGVYLHESLTKNQIMDI